MIVISQAEECPAQGHILGYMPLKILNRGALAASDVPLMKFQRYVSAPDEKVFQGGGVGKMSTQVWFRYNKV